MTKQTKKVAIVQSSYIPWKGYFDLIHSVDEFILFDDVQYTKRDWRSRNMIKLKEGGTRWLTIPIKVKGNYHQLICEAEVADATWAEQHWEIIRQNYRLAPCFKRAENWVKKWYEAAAQQANLSQINLLFIRGICDFLGIKTKLSWSLDYAVPESAKSERLLHLCLASGSEKYLSGPSAQTYLDEALFQEHKIDVEWANYNDYLPYHQLGGEFTHTVSILDMIFNLGQDTSKFMKSF